jgi:hypothetical protein
METVNSRTVFESLKVGQWLDTPNGTFEVVSPYNDTQKAICAAEVLFNNIDGEAYGVSDAFWRTYADMHGATIL